MMAIEKRHAIVRPEIPGTSMADANVKLVSVSKEPWDTQDPLVHRICWVDGCDEPLRSDNSVGVCDHHRRKLNL